MQTIIVLQLIILNTIKRTERKLRNDEKFTLLVETLLICWNGEIKLIAYATGVWEAGRSAGRKKEKGERKGKVI